MFPGTSAGDPEGNRGTKITVLSSSFPQHNEGVTEKVQGQGELVREVTGPP